MERHRGKVENSMESMQTALLTEPVPVLSLRRKLGKVEGIWSEIKGLYDHLYTLTEENQREQDRVAFTTFENCYTKIHGRVEEVL